MGVGATGYIGRQHYQNEQTLGSYREALQNGNLPQQRLGELPEQQLGVEPIIQSLFCYGELDGRQVEHLPGERRFAVESVIAEATGQLWLEAAGYLWRLTPCGRTHLRQLFLRLTQPGYTSL